MNPDGLSPTHSPGRASSVVARGFNPGNADATRTLKPAGPNLFDRRLGRRALMKGAIGAAAAASVQTVIPRRGFALQATPPIADGQALVTSPRLPLFGVGE